MDGLFPGLAEKGNSAGSAKEINTTAQLLVGTSPGLRRFNTANDLTAFHKVQLPHLGKAPYGLDQPPSTSLHGNEWLKQTAEYERRVNGLRQPTLK